MTRYSPEAWAKAADRFQAISDRRRLENVARLRRRADRLRFASTVLVVVGVVLGLSVLTLVLYALGMR